MVTTYFINFMTKWQVITFHLKTLTLGAPPRPPSSYPAFPLAQVLSSYSLTSLPLFSSSVIVLWEGLQNCEERELQGVLS